LIIWFYARVITAYTRSFENRLFKFHFIFQLRNIRNIYRVGPEVFIPLRAKRICFKRKLFGK